MRFYLDRMKVLGTPGHQATPWGVSCLCWFTRRSRHLSLITLSHRHWPWMAHNYPSLWTSIRDLFLNCGLFLNDSEFSYHHGKRSTGRFCQTSQCKNDLENAPPFLSVCTSSSSHPARFWSQGCVTASPPVKELHLIGMTDSYTWHSLASATQMNM